MGKKILLADDSITIQKVIELTFSDEDFDVITVGNGRLALERLAEVRPDIVLCDIIMPEKDGYEVCEAVKRNPAWSHVPVLLLTGAFEPFDQERASRAGYDGSLAKPFEPETLIAKVKELLARAPARTPPPPAPLVPPVLRVAVPPPVPPPIPPPVVPFARPALAVPPPVSRVPEPESSFIPDEPFGALDETSFGDETVKPADEALVAVTPEESATLSAPPPAESSRADAATTVMFRASELPWSAPPTPPPSPAPVVPVVEVTPKPEPAFVPEAAEPEAETPGFEEVLEEDLEFGPGPLAPEVAEVPDAGPEGTTLPPIPPAREPVADTSTGAFSALRQDVEGPAVYVEPEETDLLEPELEPELPPLPRAEPKPAPKPVVDEGFGLGREELTFEAEVEPVTVKVLPAASVPVVQPKPEPAPPPATRESFADVASAVATPEPPPPPPSEAAAVAVPVDMVEKIAHRVVGQISEKVVREIAWEVIPDLAEALIKQEIERLKAELQKI